MRFSKTSPVKTLNSTDGRNWIEKFMNTHTDKAQENKSQAVSNSLTQKEGGSESTFQFADNRPESIAQRKIQVMVNNSSQVSQLRVFQAMADNSPQVKQADQQAIQKKGNNTGLPNNLKSGIENLSGFSMDDVKVHYNSDKPSKLNAHAYAQGTDINLASGQEKHLPHEAWHVVQQKQGRVKPTIQMKDKLNINDDAGLEKEADLMGSKALQMRHSENQSKHLELQSAQKVAQLVYDYDALGTEFNKSLQAKEPGKPTADEVGFFKGAVNREVMKLVKIDLNGQATDGEISKAIQDTLEGSTQYRDYAAIKSRVIDLIAKTRPYPNLLIRFNEETYDQVITINLKEKQMETSYFMTPEKEGEKVNTMLDGEITSKSISKTDHHYEFKDQVGYSYKLTFKREPGRGQPTTEPKLEWYIDGKSQGVLEGSRAAVHELE